MKEQVIDLIENHIAGLYSRAKELLLAHESYTDKETDLNTISSYIVFLESALTKPYNRLYSLSSFVEDDCGLMTKYMMPLARLSDKTRSDIKELSAKAVRLATALDVGGLIWRMNPLLRKFFYEYSLP